MMSEMKHRRAVWFLTTIALTLPYVAAAQQAPDRPGKNCLYLKSKGYWAPTLREQRKRTRECLIRFSYEIAAGPKLKSDAGLYAADYCQQAYTYEEEKQALADKRPPNLDAARSRAAAYARLWFDQASALKCTPASAR